MIRFSLQYHYCLFYRKGRLQAAWVQSDQNQQLQLIPLEDQSFSLGAHRLVWSWGEAPLEAKKSQALEHLAIQWEHAQHQQAQHDLTVLHASLDTEKDYSLEDLISVSKGSLTSVRDDGDALSLVLALEQERLLFKKKGGVYTPRTTEELAQLQEQQAQKEAKAQWMAQVEEWVTQLQAEAWVSDEAKVAEEQQWIEQLRSVLIEQQHSPYWSDLAPILRLKSLPPEERDCKPRQWLDQMGAPVSVSELALLRAQVSQSFSDEVQEAAQQLQQSPFVSQVERRDLQDLPTFSVDAASTQDYDDAFSVLEYDENRVTLAIHITDLSEWVPPESTLFQEAEGRLFSLYTTEGVISMFPEALANETFSLCADKKRPAMSFFFELSCDREPQFLELQPTWIRVDQNLSYDEADQLIEHQDTFWPSLAHACQAIEQQRYARGAVKFERYEQKIDISNPQQIEIFTLDRNTPANRIIEELAILVNLQTALWYCERQLPGLYRTQAPYRKVKNLPPEHILTAQDVQLQSTRFSTHPKPHAGLGCRAYMQMTSPIRRFSDLATQLQIMHYLRFQRLYFTQEQWMGWMHQIGLQYPQYAKAERRIENYWKCRYLEQNSSQIVEAQIKRHLSAAKSLVILKEIGYSFPITRHSHYEVGQCLSLKLTLLNCEQPLITAEEVL